MKQKTIKNQIIINGMGIHTGQKTKVVLKPAPENTGIVFIRTDLHKPVFIPANASYLLSGAEGKRRSSISKQGVVVHTIEHFMASFLGLGIDNIFVEIDSEEVPGLDGSAAEIVKLLKQSGIEKQNAARNTVVITEPISFQESEASLTILPYDGFKISYVLDYKHKGLESQYESFDITENIFEQDIALSRTFCLKKESDLLLKEGLGKGASLKNTVIIDEDGSSATGFRSGNEPLRHKVLDLIGDIYLSGFFIKGHLIGIKSGHSMNLKMAKTIRHKHAPGIVSREMGKGVSEKIIFDVNGIKNILPHREPFLLVDEIIDMQEMSAVGVKYIKDTEYYFKGHFPGRPVMPGVLMLEALAQVGGVLMLNKPENKGKMAYFMSINNAKFRKVVQPGDILKLAIEVTRYRTKVGQVHGIATVKNDVVAEADLMFSMVN